MANFSFAEDSWTRQIPLSRATAARDSQSGNSAITAGLACLRATLK
jgi:hypothetical protein